MDFFSILPKAQTLMMLPFHTVLLSIAALFAPFSFCTGSSRWRGWAEEKKGATKHHLLLLRQSPSNTSQATHPVLSEAQARWAGWAGGNRDGWEPAPRASAVQLAPPRLTSPCDARAAGHQDTGKAGLGGGGGRQVGGSCFLHVKHPGQLLLTAEEQRIVLEGAFIPRNMLPETGLRYTRWGI